VSVPALRFPEFEGDWEDTKAGDAFTNSRAKGEAGLPIYSVTMDSGLVRRDSLDRHMHGDAADETNLRAQSGDIVYNMMRMWQGAAGIADEECMVSPAYVVLSPKEKTSSEFFNYCIENARMLYKLWAYSHGLTSDRLRLYFADFARIPVNQPSLPEQKKIAAFLGTVDDKISALTSKRDLLKEYKCGLMQKLFSQELRFTKPNGQSFPDWEEKRLGDVARVFSGGTPSASVRRYYSGNIPFIKSGEIGSETTKQFLTQEGFDSSSAKIVEIGDLLYALYGATTGEVKLARVSGAINQAVLCIRTEHSKEFLLHWLGSNKDRLKAKFLQGGQGNFSADIVKKIKIVLPHPDEQQKIADALSALDAKISAVADQITALQDFKKGLLQQMFI